ncbi:CHAT domain-containing protein [Sorangium sp. So ce381]|uniref:CHAT domain-containing protein n=1 Tax=Sorangium sp. So ce381 TaxID=3133307 RepID=UPI003F5C040B
MDHSTDELLRCREAIDSALGDQAARRRLIREIARRFDVDFDVPLKHDRCLGLLILLGATDLPDDDDPDQLLGFITAGICRIVRADIGYRYLEALEAIADSQFGAERLRQQIEEAPGADGVELARYALARWLDAKAKIDYRLGDFSTARLGFESAIAEARKSHHTSCLPDLRSNKIRAAFEEQRAARASFAEARVDYAPLVAQYAELEVEVRVEARALGLPELERCPDDLRDRSVEARELLRGLSNVLHNSAIALDSAKDTEASLAKSELSERLCHALRDDYRRAQVLVHQGRLLFDRGKLASKEDRHDVAQRDFAHARRRFEEVSRLGWGRGRRIAAQHLARITGEGTGDDAVSKAVDAYRALFAEFARERARPGAEIGDDLPFEATTIDHFEQLIRQHEGRLGKQYSELRRSARRERLHSIRTVRRIVKVAQYKRDYARHVVTALRAETALRLARAAKVSDARVREKIDDSVLLLAEEATGRELLDALAASMGARRDPYEEIPESDVDSGAPASGSPAPASGSPAPPSDAPLSSGSRAEPEDGTDLELRRERRNMAFSKDAVQALVRQYAAFEQAALRAPVATVSVNAEIAHAIRMFTAEDDRRVLVRYFYENGSEGRRLRAFVSRRGESQILGKPLDIGPVLEHAKAWALFKAPPLELAELMFSRLIEPVSRCVGPLDASTRLVLVPADELLSLPLHVALGEQTGRLPLAAATQLCFSVSAVAHVDRDRHRFGRFRVAAMDDLCALVHADQAAKGRELIGLRWPADRFHVFGNAPVGLKREAYTALSGDAHEALQQIAELRPELVVFSGHGEFDDAHADIGPVLVLGDLRLTQFDVAQKVSLPRNKLTLLGACVTGRGASLDGGEIGGFLRALMAAGSGAIGLTHWNVRNIEVERTIHALFQGAAWARDTRKVFDMVEHLRRTYAKRCAKWELVSDAIEACPLALYL